MPQEPPIALRVNGVECETRADADTPLVYVLRNDLGLVGTRFGCGEERCGACLVHLDGRPAYACTATVGDATGKSIATVESLATDTRLHPLQQAFLDEQAAQCGFCTSGMLMRATALLTATPDPDEAAVREALEPQLCRCGVYARIVRAVLRAAAAMRAP